ncbi:MAG: hypothetical protein F6J98_47225, partial [Moorea sp. SIO4G2]|nr:hypothetical protein [Moorena sp. SIO4G2]
SKRVTNTIFRRGHYAIDLWSRYANAFIVKSDVSMPWVRSWEGDSRVSFFGSSLVLIAVLIRME